MGENETIKNFSFVLGLKVLKSSKSAKLDFLFFLESDTNLILGNLSLQSLSKANPVGVVAPNK